MTNKPPCLIVGLGNPGEKYARTRHNLGFCLLDALCAEINSAPLKREARFNASFCRTRVATQTINLLKPETFMNDSGMSVAACAKFYKVPISEIIVAHDELSLASGDLRLKCGGGHGGHNGVRDIVRHLGAGFWRLQIGIGRPPLGHDVAAYVLSRAPAADADASARAIERGAVRVADMLRGDLEMHDNALA